MAATETAPTANATAPNKHVLTAAQITAKLSNVRKRGIHPEAMRRFVLSGDVYVILNDPDGTYRDYHNQTPEQLEKMVQGLKLAYTNIRNKALVNQVTNTPAVQVLFDKSEGNLYLINETALAATQAQED